METQAGEEFFRRLLNPAIKLYPRQIAAFIWIVFVREWLSCWGIYGGINIAIMRCGKTLEHLLSIAYDQVTCVESTLCLLPDLSERGVPIDKLHYLAPAPDHPLVPFIQTPGPFSSIQTTLVIGDARTLQVWNTTIDQLIQKDIFRTYTITNDAPVQKMPTNTHIAFITLSHLKVLFKSTIKSGRTHNTPYAYGWRRVIVDEAHELRNPTTDVAKACSAISASLRWAITATPLQNNPNDVRSLLVYLKMNHAILNQWKENGFAAKYLNARLSVDFLRGILLRVARFRNAADAPLSEQELHPFEYTARLACLPMHIQTPPVVTNTDSVWEEDIIMGTAPSGTLAEFREFATALRKYITDTPFKERARIITALVAKLRCDWRSRWHLRLRVAEIAEWEIDPLESDIQPFYVLLQEQKIRANLVFHDMVQQITPTAGPAPNISSIDVVVFARPLEENTIDQIMYTVFDDLRRAGNTKIDAQMLVVSKFAAQVLSHPDVLRDEAWTMALDHAAVKFPRMYPVISAYRQTALRYNATDRLNHAYQLCIPTKMRMLGEYIATSIKPTEKVIIWFNSRKAIRIYHAYLERGLKKKVRSLFNTTDDPNWSKTMQQFRETPAAEFQYLLLGIDSFGKSLNLQVAKHSIMINPWYAPNKEAQAHGRLQGQGRDGDACFVLLTCKNTEDWDIQTVSSSKEELTRTITDGKISLIRHKYVFGDTTEKVNFYNIPDGLQWQALSYANVLQQDYDSSNNIYNSHVLALHAQ